LHDRFLRNDLSAPVDEKGKQVECSSAQYHRLAPAERVDPRESC
jgi:hypothetical protein